MIIPNPPGAPAEDLAAPQPGTNLPIAETLRLPGLKPGSSNMIRNTISARILASPAIPKLQSRLGSARFDFILKLIGMIIVTI